jgi:hypothetical protein
MVKISACGKCNAPPYLSFNTTELCEHLPVCMKITLLWEVLTELSDI